MLSCSLSHPFMHKAMGTWAIYAIPHCHITPSNSMFYSLVILFR
ncbi:MAG: hypothetical protein J6T52_04120 [Bacteroidaceae bacterium]|nr:hypothetical protein [Bacteroidaceae bacterium]